MMQYKGYIGKVEYDAEKHSLHGEVVGIRDVVTFQGKSVDELHEAFTDSVDDYLEFCKQRGEEPDKPYSGRFVLRINSALHRRINLLAGASGKSLNAWVSECLGREVAKQMPIDKSRRKTTPRTKPKNIKQRTRSKNK